MRALSSVRDGWDRLSVRQSFRSFAHEAWPLAQTHVCHVFSLTGCLARDPRGLFGVIGPQDGKPRSPCRNGGGETFFPWAAPIPREPRKSGRRHPPLRSGPKGCGVDRLRPVDRHRGRDGRGLEQPRRNDMATIGSFKKSGNEFQGEIVTLSVQAKGVRIVPETSRTSDNAPSHRVFVGRAEIGAAWSKRSNEGRDYLSVKLDDPSFTTPIYANLFDDEGGTA
jgi:uncharacterized protein (DUF736 family)